MDFKRKREMALFEIILPSAKNILPILPDGEPAKQGMALGARRDTRYGASGMTKRENGFDRAVGQGSVAFDPVAGQARLQAERQALAEMKAAAVPPAAMAAAPAAPARGVMQLVQNWDVSIGGIRRADGAHWITPTPLDLENHNARLRHGDEAADRAETRAARAGRQATRRDVELELRRIDAFTPSQQAMAKRYAELVEWRAAAGVKCGKLEPGMGGAGGDPFIARFMDAGAELAALQRAIGDDVALSARRHMDRGNDRRDLTTRAALDAMVLRGWPISRLLKAYGWAANGRHRKLVRDAICGALDRMAGDGLRPR